MASSRRKKQPHNQRADHQLRIIGGQWRGRKLRFADAPGLRPTPDRVRETLFNWLAPVIPGARCLDLFAGSGALSLEALSRGAASATLIDNAAEVAEQLRANVQLLQGCAEVIRQSADQWLASAPPRAYDVVFLDPPFNRGLLEAVVTQIVERDLLADDAWVYIETAVSEPLPALPQHWTPHREKRAGQVSYRLFHCLQARA